MLKPKDLLESLEKVAYSDDMLEPNVFRSAAQQNSAYEALVRQQQLSNLAGIYASDLNAARSGQQSAQNTRTESQIVYFNTYGASTRR